MLYEFAISYSDGHKSFPIVTWDEFRNQLAYCQTGIIDGWISKWVYKIIKKPYNLKNNQYINIRYNNH